MESGSTLSSASLVFIPVMVALSFYVNGKKFTVFLGMTLDGSSVSFYDSRRRSWDDLLSSFEKHRGVWTWKSRGVKVILPRGKGFRFVAQDEPPSFHNMFLELKGFFPAVSKLVRCPCFIQPQLDDNHTEDDDQRGSQILSLHMYAHKRRI